MNDLNSGITELIPERNPDGKTSLRLNKRYLHSRKNPEREAERVIDSLFDPSADIFILFGMGWGYYADSILERMQSEQTLMIILPSQNYASCLSKIKDFSSLYRRDDVYLFSLDDPDEVIYLLEQNISARIQIIRQRALYQIFKDNYHNLENRIADLLSRREINKSTLKKFGKQWIRNLSANQSELHRSRSLDIWKNKLKDFPAVIIAAGPSLQKMIPILKELKRRAVLICVDTALRTILKNGISPDFVLVSDPQYWNSRHLDYCHQYSHILISDLTVHPDVLRKTDALIYLGAGAFPLGNQIEKSAGIITKLSSGGSVATTAWDFARFAGVKRAYFCGLDLGFPDKQTHYKGSQFETRALNLGTRLVPAETHSFHALYDCHPHSTENYYGKQVLSDRRMSIYINWFSERTAAEKELKTFTFSPEGVKIDSIFCQSPEQFINEYPSIRPQIETLIQEINNNSAPLDNRKAELQRLSIINKLTTLHSLVCKAVQLNLELKEKIANKQESISSLIKELDAIDSQLLNSPYKDTAGFLLMPLLDEFKEDNESDVLIKSEKLYNNLQETLALHIKHLSRH